MTYVFFPVADGRVIQGSYHAAGYSAESQNAARADCLSRNPTATGTARCFVGEYDGVAVGDAAGLDPLDAVERRGEADHG